MEVYRSEVFLRASEQHPSAKQTFRFNMYFVGKLDKFNFSRSSTRNCQESFLIITPHRKSAWVYIEEAQESALNQIENVYIQNLLQLQQYFCAKLSCPIGADEMSDWAREQWPTASGESVKYILVLKIDSSWLTIAIVLAR